jgi:hypothetical protein
MVAVTPLVIRRYSAVRWQVRKGNPHCIYENGESDPESAKVLQAADVV